MVDVIKAIIELISELFTIVASGIAIYLYFFKKEVIKSIFDLLLNYSIQISISELKVKLEKLNDLTANDAEQKEEITNILNEIVGQLRGNSILKESCKEILTKLSHFAENSANLTEPQKRSIVSELRENLRNIDLQNYNDLIRREQ